MSQVMEAPPRASPGLRPLPGLGKLDYDPIADSLGGTFEVWRWAGAYRAIRSQTWAADREQKTKEENEEEVKRKKKG